MTARVVLQSASRSRWLARRRRGITATDAAAVLGCSPWATPLSVWLDKVAPEPRPDSYAMARGRALESVVAEEWARRHGAWLHKPPMLVAHPDHPLLLCSLDYTADTEAESVVLEVKTSSDWAEWADGDLPDQYAVQALMQAAITGLPVVVVADVNGRIEVRRIERDPDWEADAIPRLLDWWDRHVVGQVPPPLDPYRDYVLLSRVWRTEPGTEAEADDAVMGALQAYVALRERAAERDRTMTGLRTQIRAHMGTAAVLTHPETGQRVARVDKRGALTVTYTPPTAQEEAA